MAHPIGKRDDRERLVYRGDPRYGPKAPPAEPDDWRVEELLKLYPNHDARRWVQSMVGWQRRSDAIEAEAKRRLAERPNGGQGLYQKLRSWLHRWLRERWDA